jgi:hypothetical protein
LGFTLAQADIGCPLTSLPFQPAKSFAFHRMLGILIGDTVDAIELWTDNADGVKTAIIGINLMSYLISIKVWRVATFLPLTK